MRFCGKYSLSCLSLLNDKLVMLVAIVIIVFSPQEAQREEAPTWPLHPWQKHNASPPSPRAPFFQLLNTFWARGPMRKASCSRTSRSTRRLTCTDLERPEEKRGLPLPTRLNRLRNSIFGKDSGKSESAPPFREHVSTPPRRQ